MIVRALTDEPPACSICFQPASAEFGPLRAFDDTCTHTFHTQCITQRAQLSETGFPLCHQRLSIIGVTAKSLDAISTSAAFREELLRNGTMTTMKEHSKFVESLGLASVRKLQTAVRGPGSAFEQVHEDEALCFVKLWLQVRGLDPTTYFRRTKQRVAVIHDRDGNPCPSYWIGCRLGESVKRHGREFTAQWEPAYHGSIMSVLNAILQRGCLDTGPRGKRSTRREKTVLWSVLSQTQHQAQSCELRAIFPLHGYGMYRNS